MDPQASEVAGAARAPARSSPWFLLGVLTAVNAVNWADRNVVSVLFPAIRADLSLSDTELGIIGGLAFSAIYAISSFGFGYAADRHIRRTVLALGLVIWSVATAASGLATGFTSLFAARFFTGIGEASLYPAAMSLLAERFAVASRGRAMGIFGAAAAVGGGLGIGLGGLLADALGWRRVFFTYGAVGLLLVPLALSVPERRRPPPVGEDARTLEVLLRLIRDRRLLAIWLAGLLMMASGMGYSTWAPSYFVRVRGMEVHSAGLFFGIAVMIGGMGGAVLGGLFADRCRRRRFAGELDVPVVAAALAVPLATAVLVVTWPPAFLAAGILAPMAIFAYFPAIQTVVVELVPPRQHGIAYAVNILFLAGVGSALGPFLVGWVSDRTQSLTWAMAVPVVGMTLASLVMAAAARLIRRDHARRASEGK